MVKAKYLHKLILPLSSAHSFILYIIWGSLSRNSYMVFFCVAFHCCIVFLVHCRYTYIVPADKGWGLETQNGSWNGMIGQLQRKVILQALTEKKTPHLPSLNLYVWYTKMTTIEYSNWWIVNWSVKNNLTFSFEGGHIELLVLLRLRQSHTHIKKQLDDSSDLNGAVTVARKSHLW